jgi:4-diphosphocytidyl-2-C-methyl-D-erythritol kinase
VAAQAKVNLLLRVLAREESGFHSIETIFLRLDLADDVVVRAGDDVRGRALDVRGDGVDASVVGPTEQNLAYRAALSYREATGWPSGFALELTKRIPVGGGLGGGSSDAGAVLRALDALSPNPLGSRLIELASELGSDVSFLAQDSPMALAWGRGERLFPLAVLASRAVVLLVPSFRVATKDAYQWLATERGAYVPRAVVVRQSDADTWEGVTALAQNEFESVVGRRHREIGTLVDVLRQRGAFLALMSGSGSTVFGVFDDEEAARRAAAGAGGGVRALLTRTAERVARVEVV